MSATLSTLQVTTKLEMLQAIGYDNFDQLFRSVPQNLLDHQFQHPAGHLRNGNVQQNTTACRSQCR